MKVADSKTKKPKTFPFAALPDLKALLENQRRVTRALAKSFTGHKTYSVYERYAIVDTAAQEDGAEKLAKLFQTEKQRTVVPIRKAATG